MSRKFSNLPLGAFVFILLSCSPSGGQQEAEEPLIRKTLEAHCAALINKDIEAVKALWAQNSPDYENHLKRLKQAFQAPGRMELKTLTIDNVRVSGDTARAEVGEVVVTSRPTAGATADEANSSQFVTLIKEGGTWKLYGYEDANKDFFVRFVKAQTKGERANLLRERGRHVTKWMASIILSASMEEAAGRHYEHALELVDKASELAEYLGFETQIGLCHGFRGSIFFQQSQYPPALRELLAALPLLRKGGERTGEAETLRGIARIFRQLQKSGESPRFAQRVEILLACLPIARELGDQAIEMEVLQSLVEVYMESGKFEEALRISRSAFLLAKRTNDRGKQAYALAQIGSAYEGLNRYEDALNIFAELESAMVSAGKTDAARAAHQSVLRLRKLLRR